MSYSDVIAKPYAAGVLEDGPVKYYGITLRETAGAVASVRVWDNATAASGTLLDTIGFAANASLSLYYHECGIRAENGIFLETVAGAVEGSVRVG